jgi:hypothetical protein
MLILLQCRFGPDQCTQKMHAMKNPKSFELMDIEIQWPTHQMSSKYGIPLSRKLLDPCSAQ